MKNFRVVGFRVLWGVWRLESLGFRVFSLKTERFLHGVFRFILTRALRS